ncbi:non-ribosomal peptide synthetase/type I polyketide synthase [Corallococcus sp. AS-1-6]|uniref:non-ribosomal peptide synthetase/type I polyketide synthase n=1 Tax=Corallococcus sp. AS-1-6 TaxID=2874599 RepID=UPI001CC13640
MDVDAPVTRYGLDSLGAVELAHEVGAGTGLTVPMEWLLQGPSITSLAHRLISLRDSAGPSPRRVSVGGDREASSSQARLFFLSRYAPGDVSYNLPAAVRLEGDLDVAALEGSLVALAARHEGLRTSFREAPGQPRQIIAEDASLPLARVSLESLPADAREAEALRLAHEEARRPFDLERGPLVRATLLTLDARTHVLVLVMHHAVSDATSMAVLVREVSALYSALCEGRPSPLPALPLDYADAADWQRDALDDATLESRLDYWRTQLAGAPPLLELATDRPRPSRRGSAGARVPVLLDARLADSVRRLAEREGVTPFMVLLAAFQTVLARRAGQDDISVGTAITGRQRAEFQGLVGLFVNSLVLRTRLTGAPSFRELLARVRETALGAYAHRDVPFERVVEALRPPRELGHTPLFQVMFNLQGARVDAPVLKGLQSRLLDVHTGTSMFDLTLSLAESPQGFEGWLEYATELFDADAVARLAGHLRVLLEAAIADPRTPIHALPWMTDAERHQVLTAWNDTARDYPADRTIPEAFALQVARTPDAIAVEDGDVRLTYAQLEARANPLAHFLRARGVGPDVPVAVCMERSVDFVVTVLAILKAGGAYVPLDASYPARRLAFMMEDARPRMLLTTRALRERLNVPDATLACFFVDALALDDQPVTAPEVTVGPRNLAYVIFTSGSSGRPKGVASEHRGVLRLVHAEPYSRVGPRETGMLFAPLSFDGSVMELWTMLLHGGRLVVFPGKVPAGDMDTLARVVERHAVGFAHLPSGLFSQLVEHRPDILGRLRAVHVAGDVISAPHVRRAVELLGRPVINAYGPSECSVAASFFTVERPEQAGASVPIGAPLANTTAYVLDARLQPVPVGVPGELFLGGDGVVRGYVSRPDLTAERFVPDVWGAKPGARLYRTGDRVRWRADGTLDFLGRTDHQVKVRGFRIELPEVEAALRELPEVHEAAAVVREDVPGDKRLVAYAMPRPGQVLEASRLREALRRKLPDYMVPSLFVALPTLPLNPSGKVDRKALPAPDSEATGRRERYVAPAHPLEEQIASTWARELGADRVGTQDHLFNDLGGTSLSVMRLASRLKETLGRDVPVVWLFEHPTAESLAQRLEHESRSPGAPSPITSGHRPREASKPGASGSIAIIGMAGRFPGAMSVAEFWRNLREGVESITRFSPEELEHLPSLPEGFELWYHPAFVPAAGVLDDVEGFDHAFFDMSLREAQFTDPQQRLFLQTAWAALEDAGVNPERYPGAISLYAGAAASGYAEAVRQAMPLDAASFFELNGTATHESLPTKASFKLGLTGESTLLYTACSTGLVAVHLACQSLRTGQSDVALAGASRLSLPQRTGYVAQEGLIFSPDGHCRAFDAKAQGTLPGNGVGAVVLKRLEDAVRDGDAIYAVIRGSALNNDGRNKSGFTAPSVQGQAAVVSQALANAGVAPEAVGYVEAHGTATPLGDPIEVAALTRAYGLGAEHRGRIALASLKTNVGHLDTAAGLAGLMKAALALHHGEIPPSLHFEKPNPRIDFDAGPFFVNTTLRSWPRGETPRFAAVSSFGIGGTNAHAILEEAPMRQSGSTTRSHQLVVLSARSPEALEAAARRLEAKGVGDTALADLAFTHAVGRKAFEYRRAVVVKDAEDLSRQLQKAVTLAKSPGKSPRVAFVFSGQGSQRLAMGRELAEASPLYRAHLDACLALLDAPLRARVSAVLAPEADAASADLADTRVALPALFSVQVALAWMWRDLGVTPAAVMGHSFGEYAAACVSEALPVEDGMRLAVARGELMHRMPPGAMLAVALPVERVQALLSGRLSVAAVNAPDRCVVSGPVEEVERLEAALKEQKAGAVRMPAPHAFHSADVEPLMPELARVVGTLRWSEPAVRYVSSLTGTGVGPGQLAAPDYWTEQMRQPVRFTRAVEALQADGCTVLLEVGPGQDVTPLVRANLVRPEGGGAPVLALASLRVGGKTTEQMGWLQAVGELWTAGVSVDWSAFYAHEQRLRLHLPTYAFQTKAVWVQPRARATTSPFAPPTGRPVQAPRTLVEATAAPVERAPEVASELALVTASIRAPQSVSAMTATAGRVPPSASAMTAPNGAPQSGSVTTESNNAPQSGSELTESIGVLQPEAAASSHGEVVSPDVSPVAPPPPGRDDAPRGDIEERVAALWRDRLGLEFVGRHDDFLELGGNSLTAAQLLNQLREAFGVNLPLAVLFEAPTVAGIAEHLEPLLLQAPQAPVSTELPLVPLPRDGSELPLSFVQERVWRLEQHLPGLSAYNLPFVLRLEGDLDADVMERGIQEIVQRHEALRTTYDTVDGRPVQRFHPRMRVPLTRVELRGPMETREPEALRLAREDAAKPFDLVRGPVLRTTLVRLDAKVHLLIASIHHIVSDTMSIALLVQELGQLYDAFLQGKPSPLKPLPLQYADFGAWQRRGISSGRLAEQDQGWRQRLAGMPRRLDLPTDRPRSNEPVIASQRMTLDFPPALAHELVAFTRREGFTGYMTVLAAWQTLLHRYSGQTDIVVGTPIANRTRPELLSLIGYVAHSAAFRTRFTEGLTFRELLAQVRGEVADAQSRPDVPFEYLVEALVPGHDIGRGRMTDSVFVYHTGASSSETLELIGLRGTLVEVPGTPVQWGSTLSALTLVLFESPTRVHGALEYASDLFDPATTARLMDHFQVLLGAALANPDTQVAHLPLATDDERRAWPTPRATPGLVPVPSLLAERRARHAGATALSQGETHWSWAELGARADALSARLKSLGVKAGTPVAVCLRTSPEKLAALWGVLGAGGACVALGPSDLSHLPVYAPEGAPVPVLVTTRALVASVRVDAARVVYVEDVPAASEPAATAAPVEPHALAWLLPTGRGQPAWALGHRELAEFFTGLDARLSPPDGGAWLAASEPSSDRPELEALWALSRGLRVVFPPERITARLVSLGDGGPRAKAMDLSLIYFANDEDTLQGPKYELLLEGAKFADANGFSAVWTPERHFHSFGGLYPQPAVVAAGLATVTKHLRLRSGSVVLPLHDPLLIAEQWSVVDNLSQGRVGLSVATGWHTQDFTFAPANYEKRRDILLEKLSTLRALWRGERFKRPAGAGSTAEVGLRPKPVQKELPVWLTATGNPETFRMAGELGAGVLTGLLSHTLEELKQKVALYRDAWRRNGHPGRGHITCMLHTYLGDEEQEVLRTVRQPLLSYFRSSVDISTSLLQAQGITDVQKLSPEDINAVLERTFENHAKNTGLLGTVDSALRRLRDVRAADVDEVAALIDFGLDTPVVLEGLRRLAVVRERMDAEAAARQEQVLVEAEAGVEGLLELARQSGAVLLHTSARLARSLSELPGARESLARVGALVLEGASVELGAALHRAAGVEVWLSGDAQEGALLPRTLAERIPANLQAWVLDAAGQPVPAGVVGELALAGAGLPSALWRAGDEEHRRLVPHPREASAKLFRTGRHARLRGDGRLEPVASPSRLPPPPVARPAAVEAPRPVAPATPARVDMTPPPIPRVGRDRPLPLSFAQQRLWYLQQLEPTSSAYNNPAIFRLTGELDRDALQAALDAMVVRHEVLRTTYALDGDHAVQVIHPPRGLPLQHWDAAGDTPEAREAAMRAFCQDSVRQPFDLEQEVVRAALIRLGAREHVLLVTFHHAVSDAWCTLVIAHELTVNYTAFRTGQPSPLPELPVQYADYAVWQRAWLEGGVMEKQVAWWKDHLAGAPPLSLPTDRPRPAVMSSAGARHTFLLPSTVSAPLLALGRKHGATSFMVLMALFQTVLSRYSGQDDFVVGTPIAGRTRPELEWLMGCFINTLPFRSRLSGQPSFVELLGRVRTQALEAYAHQDAPFERVLDSLELPRDLSRTPLFQVSINVVSMPEVQGRLPSLELTPVEVPTGTAKFDLGMEVVDGKDGFTCSMEYATALFDAATMERLARHMVGLAREVVAHPQTSVALLPLMDAAERQRVLVEWNDTFQDFPQDARIPDLFARQVAARPDAVAVEAGGERLTYAQLDARANQWAYVLREHGVGPDVLVAVCLERSLELVVALLAAVKAGGAYLPLDPSYPAPRLAAMLEDAPAKVLLTTRTLRAAVPLPPELPSVFVEELSSRELPTAPVVPGADSRHLAYVDFTSGSTGRPKGVAVDHRAVMRLLHHPAFARMGANETFLQLAPISFDPVTLEIWGPLLHGGRLVMFPPTSPSDLDVLAQVIQRHGVTAMMLTAGLFTQVVDLKPEALTDVRQLLVGGDVVSPPHVRKVLEAHPGLVVTAGYGPTEATLIAATHVMTDAARVDAPVPLGRPIARTDLYVLDARGQPVPPGIPGELHIGGEGLARGYISRPDLTAERFIPHPFSSRPGERLYRTGDLTRWRADGTLDFLGRTDQQVKVRGFRIELSEVESALGAHPDVREAVAVVREDVPGDKRLVAYVVAPSAPQPEALRDFMRQRVPDYMLPSAFVLLESLPLTAQGKVDRKALPAPEGQRASRREYVAPRTPREQALAQVMAQVLRVERVGLDDNFFELGGDSIISLQVVAKARQAGVRLQVKDLFQHPTLGALAAVARDGEATLAEQGPVVGDVPLTPIQVDLFEREPTYPHHFNHALLLKTRQPLKADLVQKALTALVTHHDALRLRYVHAEDGTWRQEAVAPEAAPPVLLQVDLSMLAPEARLAAMEREAARLQADFDLATPPLVRVALFHFGAGEPQRLLLIIHHLVVDAVSWRILVEDLEAAYLQLQAARAPALPAKTTSFLSWAKRLEKHALSEALGEQEAFWREAMRGDVAPLPVDGPGPYTYASRSSVAVELDAEETRQLLQETPTGWRARIDDVLLTALARTLGEWTGKPDVLIELEGHGREELFADLDVSRTVGWFTSVAPALLRLPEGGSLGDGLRAVRDSLKAWPGRGIGFNLLRHLGPPETRARLAALPKAQVSFNYLGQLDGTAAASTLFTMSDEPVGPIVEPRALQPHALAVDGSVLQGRLRMTFGYSHQQHHEATVRALAERFLAVLRELIAQRHSEDARRRTPGDFPLARLSQAALDAVLAAQGPTVEDLFPLSPLQAGMLFHALNDPQAAYYFEQAGWSSHSDVDIALLQRTWQTAVDRNPILRTAFVWEGLESPLQVVHSRATLPFIVHDWRHLPEAEQPAALAKLTAEDRARGFDVSSAPLSRMTVVRLGDARWRFLWSHHHLLMDGWSMGLFFQEVFALYDAVHAGTPPPPVGRPPFRDYIAWLDRRDGAEDERFWRDQLAGLSAPTPLPSARPASLVRPTTSEKRPDARVTLPAPVTTALEAFARRHQLTLNTLTQAAWALVLARHADTRDVLFGTTLAGRPPELPGADAMLGLLITTQPVHITLPGDGEPVLPWLQSLQAKLLGIQQHQYAPLVSTHGWSDIPRGQPLFQSLFVFENYPFDESVLRRFTAMDLRDLEFGDSTNYPLSATVVPREELQLQLVYDEGRFDADAVRRVLGQWRQALEGLLQPDARLDDVSLLPAEDRAWLLRAGSGDAVDFDRDATLQARFEEQAAATPDADAVVSGGTTLTYGQLNAGANELAWQLRSLGVGPEVTVALCLERSAEAIVALLAVLKAGGAFVPLDPAAPAARKSFVLEDCGASVLVTTQALQETWHPEVPRLVRLDAKPVRQEVCAE